MVLRIEAEEDLSPGDITLRFNGTSPGEGTSPNTPQVYPERIWPGLPSMKKTVEFAIAPSLLRKENVLILIGRRPVTVRWVYLGVTHSP
jgi:hypothetical protein